MNLSLRLKTEICAWLGSLSFQLTKIGKEILEEVEKTCSEGSTDIKFIPNRLDDGIGYLRYGSILPSHLQLMLSSGIGKVREGATLQIRVEGPVMEVRNHLVVRSVCTTQPDTTVPCQEEGFVLSFVSIGHRRIFTVQPDCVQGGVVHCDSHPIQAAHSRKSRGPPCAGGPLESIG